MTSLELINNLELVYKEFGYFLIFFTSFIESSPFGWITPGGILIAGGSFFAYNNDLSLAGVIISGFLGTWIMLLLAHYLGQKTGSKITVALHQEKRAKMASKLLKKHSALILTTNLTSNVTRFWISYVAGSQNIKLKKFYFYSAIASITWVLIWASVGFLAGGSKTNLYSLLPKLGAFSWVLLLIALISIIYSSYRDEKEPGEDVI